MIYKINYKKFSVIVLFLFLVLSCFQNISFFSSDGASLKPYHVFAIFLFPFMFRNRINFPPRILSTFFFLAVIISLVNAIGFGLNIFLFNFVFAIYTMLLVMNIGSGFKEDEWLKILRAVTIIMNLAVWANIMMNFDLVLAFISNPYGGHPAIKTFFGGGVNIEASYLAMMTSSFCNDKNNTRKILIYISAVLVSILYSSRAAILICVLSIVFLFYKSEIKNNKYIVLASFSFLTFLLLKLDIQFFLDRFSSLDSESGVLGRIRMWRYAFELFQNRIIGYGLGNSIPALRIYTGGIYTESNFHNIYMQMFIDLGFIGGIYYLFMVMCFVLKEKSKVFNDSVKLFLFYYILLGMIEFRGAEAIVYFYLGIYLQQNRFGYIDKNRILDINIKQMRN